MGDGLTAMYDAMDRYEALCRRYGEQPRFAKGRDFPTLDCYGAHAQALYKRARADDDAKARAKARREAEWQANKEGTREVCRRFETWLKSA